MDISLSPAPPRTSLINRRVEPLPIICLTLNRSVTVTHRDGTWYGGAYRLATTLLDHRVYPTTC
jgi:hypothetical protein